MRQLVDTLEQSKRAEPRLMSDLGDSQPLLILDALINKEATGDFDARIVEQMQQRLDDLKASYRDEYEMQKEAMI